MARLRKGAFFVTDLDPCKMETVALRRAIEEWVRASEATRHFQVNKPCDPNRVEPHAQSFIMNQLINSRLSFIAHKIRKIIFLHLKLNNDALVIFLKFLINIQLAIQILREENFADLPHTLAYLKFFTKSLWSFIHACSTV